MAVEVCHLQIGHSCLQTIWSIQILFELTKWFGGKNVLFVGDILQLPPVNGSPVFAEVTQAAVKYRIGSMGAINIWQDTVLYDELTINERQKMDQTFSDMLDCVRRGIKSDKTISTLSQRVIKVPIEQKFDELQEARVLLFVSFPLERHAMILTIKC